MPWESTSGELLGTPPGLPNQRLQDLTPSLDVGEFGGSRRADTAIDGDKDARWARKQLDRETPRVEAWRTEARKANAFFAGDQVDDVDRATMAEDGRPIITVNATKRFIRIVDGIERRVPLSIFYVPRDPSDQQAALKGELRTKVKDWVHDRTGYQFEVATAKHDRNVTGMGWLETHISRHDDPAGIIQIRRFSPFEAVWPRTSRENLEGMRWVAREREMPIETALVKWPNAADVLIATAGSEGGPKDYPIKADLVTYRVPWKQTEPTNKGGNTPTANDEVRITDFQYTKPTEGYYFKDPVLDKFQWLPTKEFDGYSRRLRTLLNGLLPKNVEKVTKDVHWRLFLLNRSFLLSGPEKMPIDGFSLNCATGDWDDKRKIFYGMVREFIDLNLLVDKTASSAIEILGTQTKGGYLAEVGAVSETQMTELKKTGSAPGSVNMVKRNALMEKRIMPKPTPQIPAGTTALMEFGLSSMSTISGITDSILEPPAQGGSGVGLRQRLSIGLLILAQYFDSSTRFERRQGEITQGFMKLIADDRWVRIGGPFDSQIVQLAKEDFQDMYDTTVDDTTQDPTLRALFEERVMAIAPVLIKSNKFFPGLLDWFRLPVQFREDLKKFIQKTSEMEMQMKMRGLGAPGRGKQRTPEEVQAETQRTMGQGALAFAKAEHLRAQAGEVRAGRLHDDLRGVLQGLLDSNKADIDRQRMGMERDKLGLERERLGIERQKVRQDGQRGAE